MTNIQGRKQMSKLDAMFEWVRDDYGEFEFNQTKDDVKALFLELIVDAEIIGPLHPQTSTFRAELCKRVGEL